MKKHNEENEAVEEVMNKLQKKYGEDTFIINSKEKDFSVEFVSTGSFCLDEVLGGGLPKGRLIELFGQESSGKSSLAQFFMGQVQKSGGRAALIDAEFCYDPRYTASLGVDVTKLLVSQPLHLESAMETLKELVETRAFGIIVVDSVAALVPQAELEDGKFLADTMALQARKLGTALRVLAGVVSRSNTIVIFINQLREKVNVLWGKKEVTPGGKALKFFSSIRLEVKKGEKIVDKDDKQIGNVLDITAVKNKIGWPYLKTSVDLYYGKGPDLNKDYLLYGEKVGIIKKTGNTYSFNEISLGVGLEKAVKKITEDVELLGKIKKMIISNKKI